MFTLGGQSPPSLSQRRQIGRSSLGRAFVVGSGVRRWIWGVWEAKPPQLNLHFSVKIYVQ